MGIGQSGTWIIVDTNNKVAMTHPTDQRVAMHFTTAAAATAAMVRHGWIDEQYIVVYHPA